MDYYYLLNGLSIYLMNIWNFLKTNFYDEYPGVTVHENTTSASYLKASNYHYFQPQILVQLRILTVDVSFSLSRTTQTCCGPHLLSFLVQNEKLWLTCLTLSSRGKEMKIIAWLFNLFIIYYLIYFKFIF